MFIDFCLNWWHDSLKVVITSGIGIIKESKLIVRTSHNQLVLNQVNLIEGTVPTHQHHLTETHKTLCVFFCEYIIIDSVAIPVVLDTS